MLSDHSDDAMLHVWACTWVLRLPNGNPNGRRCGYITRGPGNCPYDHGEDVPLVEITATASRVTDEMVERAARAMCAVEDDSPWELSEADLELTDPEMRHPAATGAVSDEDKDWFRRHARAALTSALRQEER